MGQQEERRGTRGGKQRTQTHEHKYIFLITTIMWDCAIEDNECCSKRGVRFDKALVGCEAGKVK